MMLHNLLCKRCLFVFLVGLLLLVTPIQFNTADEQSGDNGSATPTSKMDSNTALMLQRTFLTMAQPGSDIPVSNLEGNESQVTMDINPTDSNNIVIAAHSPDFTAINTFYSLDGGKTWTPVSLDASMDGHDSIDRFDPSLTFDKEGNLYVCYGLVEDQLTFAGNRAPKAYVEKLTTLVVAKSTDGGQSYSQFTDAYSDVNNLNFLGNEKWHITTGADPAVSTQQNVYIAWTRNVNEDGEIDQQISTLTSTDGAASFTFPLLINDESISTTLIGNILAKPVAGPSGDLYVAWTNAKTGDIFMDVSTDGGITFGTDVLIKTTAPLLNTPIPAQPDLGIFTAPVIDIDKSPGPHRGRIYLTYVDYSPAGYPDTDIFVMASDDAGVTWSQAVRINDDTENNSQFLPWLDVDQKKGVVSVAWYDARNDTNNKRVETFMTISDDGGLSFGTNILISDGQSDQSTDNPDRSDKNFQKYLGLTGNSCKAYIAWAGNSANPANLDIFTDQIQFNGLDTPNCNIAPNCNAGGPYIGECNQDIPLDASQSSDVENDPLTFSWTGDFLNGTTTGETATVQFPSYTGIAFIDLEVSDALSASQCVAEVTIKDTLAPSLTAPSDITEECTAASGTPVDLGTPEASDLCDATLVVTNNAPDQFPLGATTVTWQTTDKGGNSSSDNQQVTITDTKPPEVTLEFIPLPYEPEEPEEPEEPDEEGEEEEEEEEEEEIEIITECRFEIKITATDGCDSNIEAKAFITLEDSGMKIPVVNGQHVLFEWEDDDDEEGEAEYDDGILEVEARTLKAYAEAIDAAGNVGMGEDVVLSCPAMP